MDIKTMDDLVARLYERENLKKEVASKLSEIEAECEDLRSNILNTLQAHQLSSFKGNKGTVSITNRYQVKFPKEPDQKAELGAWMKEHGCFDALWSCNHQTLNSWFKSEVETAKEQGTMLDIPHLNPTTDQILSFRKA